MSDPWRAGPGRRTHGAEGFQPHGGPAWSGPPWGGGGRRFRRGGLVALLVLALLVAGLATLITSLVSGSAPPAGITIAVSALVLLGVFLLLRWFWRSARSIGAVVDASERVATGDLAARVGDVPARPLQQLASAFDQMTSRLETDEARRRELLADIAHELRTPLQAIRGTVDGMLDGLYPVDERAPAADRRAHRGDGALAGRPADALDGGGGRPRAASRTRRPAGARTGRDRGDSGGRGCRPRPARGDDRRRRTNDGRRGSRPDHRGAHQPGGERDPAQPGGWARLDRAHGRRAALAYGST